MSILDDVAASIVANAIAHGAQTTAATSGSSQKPINIEKMAQALAELQALNPCPIAQYMRRQGFPPEQGWLLMVPEKLRADFGPFPPRYVSFHHSIDAPVIVADFLNFRSMRR